MKHAIIAVITMALTVSALSQVPDFVRIQVTVTAGAGRSVFIDRGRAAGVEPGLRVRFFPTGSAPVEGVVQDVSSNNARVEMPIGLTLPPVGTPGEMDVPVAVEEEESEPLPPGDEGEETRVVPDHPPWTRTLDNRAEDAPLLAPAFGLKPEERPVTFDGRVFMQGLLTRDRGNGRESDYDLYRVGTWIEATNLFGQGGRMLFAGEVERRTAIIIGDKDVDDRLRVDRLSYMLGGQEFSAYRFEGGRFYSIYLPEIGLLDGAEGVWHLPHGFRLGAGVGSYPRPFPSNDFAEDIGFHVFANYQSQAEHHLSALLAYQKTWHNGLPDRDQILGRVNVRPVEGLWLYTSWRADIYLESDLIKEEGIELTEFRTQASYSPGRKWGSSASYSRTTWPELKREEFASLPVELIRDGRVDRFDLSGWIRHSDALRYSARVDYWLDQNDEGFGGDMGVDWVDVTGHWPSLHANAYFTEGPTNGGSGFRIESRASFGMFNASLGYEIFRFGSLGNILGAENILRHTIRGGLDWRKGAWNYSLNADYNFGDNANAYTVGAYVEYSF